MRVLGFYVQARGDLDQAIAHHRRALTLQPARPHTLNNLGNALKERGLVRGAAFAVVVMSVVAAGVIFVPVEPNHQPVMYCRVWLPRCV
jgi:hypothetical protein